MIQSSASRESIPALGRLLEELGQQAAARRFLVAPNPCVGAAWLHQGRELARGFHEYWGGPHAEIEVLRALEAWRASPEGAQAANEGTLLVTLEPCSSVGKTPACSTAVIAARPHRVVVGALDPDPRHRGRGLELLAQAGIEVHLLEGRAPLQQVAPHFLAWNHAERLRRPRPWTTAKWAQTRSGQLSPPADVGEGRWISSPQALEEVQRTRARVDAVVTGVGTVLADDPRLTLRLPELVAGARAPLRVVLDSELRTPPEARLFESSSARELGGAVHLFCRAGASPARHRALEQRGAQIHSLRPDARGESLQRAGVPRPGMRGTHVTLSLREAWSALWDLGVRRVLVEAGPELTSALLEQGFVDQLCVYTGAVNGGRGPSLAGVFQTTRLYGRMDRECGPDAVLEAFVHTPP